MTVLGELICRPALDPAEIDREREVIVEEIRGYLDDPAEYAQILFQQAMFGATRARARDLRRGGGRPRPAGRRHPRLLGRRRTGPANAVVAVAGDLEHAEAVELAERARSGAGNGAIHGFEPAPALPAGARILTGRRDTTQAQLCVGVPGAAARPPRRLGALASSTRSSATA